MLKCTGIAYEPWKIDFFLIFLAQGHAAAFYHGSDCVFTSGNFMSHSPSSCQFALALVSCCWAFKLTPVLSSHRDILLRVTLLGGQCSVLYMDSAIHTLHVLQIENNTFDNKHLMLMLLFQELTVFDNPKKNIYNSLSFHTWRSSWEWVCKRKGIMSNHYFLLSHITLFVSQSLVLWG